MQAKQMIKISPHSSIIFKNMPIAWFNWIDLIIIIFSKLECTKSIKTANIEIEKKNK